MNRIPTTSRPLHGCAANSHGRLAWLLLATALSMGWDASNPLWAQGSLSRDVYHPLNHHAPPGTAARWAGVLNREDVHELQFVEVSLPSEGRVEIYHNGAAQPAVLTAPARFFVAVGRTYRLRLSNMPEFPGIELYPTLEVLDRLHPPAGMETKFPVPIEFTFEEIQFALSSQLVSKVVYLEQPQLAPAVEAQSPLPAPTFPAGVNLLAEADRRGRPIALIRVGGRLPDTHGSEPEFYGVGGPFRGFAAESNSATDAAAVHNLPLRRTMP